jgi:hypothetical protein
MDAIASTIAINVTEHKASGLKRRHPAGLFFCPTFSPFHVERTGKGPAMFHVE